MAHWKIRYTTRVNGELLYWSNSLGWVDEESADSFSDEERMAFQNIPLNSTWTLTAGEVNMAYKNQDKCDSCGISIPAVNEDSDPAARLCDRCYQQQENQKKGPE